MTDPLSYRRLLRLDGMPELFLAACLSRLASRMFVLAIVLYVLDRFDSPVLAGWVAFASMAPGLVVSPLAGALLDRVGAAKAIVLDMAASAVLLLALAATDIAGLVTAPLLLGFVALYSLTSPLGTAGIRVLIPRLVPKEALDLANALDTSSYALINVAGPAVAGVLFGFAGSQATMLLIVLLYAAASISLVPLVRRTSGAHGTAGGSLVRDALAGVVYVVRHVSLRSLAISYALFQVSWGVLMVAVPVVVVRELGAGAVADSVVGGLWAAAGLAGGFGALYAGHLRTMGRERQFIAIGTLATAVAIYPVSASFGLAGLAVGLVLVGFLEGPVDVGVLSLRQRRTDPTWLGRVLAVSMSFNMSGLPVGSAIGGILVVHSATLAFAVAAVASVLAAIVAWALVPAASDDGQLLH
ncbi:MFS transporter [Reyranella sp.]|uniref:MFS transporter n=1 Tax=Reyranella sp. TaxID=1929291 RepID=UPI0027320F30|nr:MFS transporter [Reyranella sp.]